MLSQSRPLTEVICLVPALRRLPSSRYAPVTAYDRSRQLIRLQGLAQTENDHDTIYITVESDKAKSMLFNHEKFKARLDVLR